MLKAWQWLVLFLENSQVKYKYKLTSRTRLMSWQLTSIISNSVQSFWGDIKPTLLWKLPVLFYFFDLFCSDAYVHSPWRHF